MLPAEPQEEVEFDLNDISSDVTTSVPTHLTNKVLATKWRKNLIKELHDIDGVKDIISNFSQLKTNDRLPLYSSTDQIKIQQLTLLTAHYHKLGLPRQELNEKISNVLGGYIYYEENCKLLCEDLINTIH